MIQALVAIIVAILAFVGGYAWRGREVTALQTEVATLTSASDLQGRILEDRAKAIKRLTDIRKQRDRVRRAALIPTLTDVIKPGQTDESFTVDILRGYKRTLDGLRDDHATGADSVP